MTGGVDRDRMPLRAHCGHLPLRTPSRLPGGWHRTSMAWPMAWPLTDTSCAGCLSWDRPWLRRRLRPRPSRAPAGNCLPGRPGSPVSRTATCSWKKSEKSASCISPNMDGREWMPRGVRPGRRSAAASCQSPVSWTAPCTEAACAAVSRFFAVGEELSRPYNDFKTPQPQPCPVCNPSRTSMLIRLHGAQTGVVRHQQVLRATFRPTPNTLPGWQTRSVVAAPAMPRPVTSPSPRGRVVLEEACSARVASPGPPSPVVRCWCIPADLIPRGTQPGRGRKCSFSRFWRYRKMRSTSRRTKSQWISAPPRGR